MAFWDDILANLETAKDQALHPVYDQLNRHIGWFSSDQDLAAGRIHLLPGEKAPPPEQWRVKSPVGYLVAADVYLLNQGLQPSWLQPGGPISQAIQADTSGTVSLPEVSLPTLPQLPGLPSLSAGGSFNVGSLALLGAFLLLGVALLRRA